MRAQPLGKPCSGLGIGHLIGHVVLAGRAFGWQIQGPEHCCWDWSARLAGFSALRSAELAQKIVELQLMCMVQCRQCMQVTCQK